MCKSTYSVSLVSVVEASGTGLYLFCPALSLAQHKGGNVRSLIDLSLVQDVLYFEELRLCICRGPTAMKTAIWYVEWFFSYWFGPRFGKVVADWRWAANRCR